MRITFVAIGTHTERTLTVEGHEEAWEIVVALNHAGYGYTVERCGVDVTDVYEEALSRSGYDAGGNPKAVPEEGDIPRPRVVDGKVI